MKKKLKDALHRYKVEAFKIAHSSAEIADISKEILAHTDEALQNAYHYHFHKDPNPQRVETFQMVKTFVLEALLPPVVEKTMRRIVALEKEHAAMVKLLDELMEALSEDDEEEAPSSRR